MAVLFSTMKIVTKMSAKRISGSASRNQGLMEKKISVAPNARMLAIIRRNRLWDSPTQAT